MLFPLNFALVGFIVNSRILSTLLFFIIIGVYIFPIIQNIPSLNQKEREVQPIEESTFVPSSSSMQPMFSDFSDVKNYRSSKTTILSKSNISQDINFEQEWYFEHNVTLMDPDDFNIADRWVSLDATFWARLTLIVPVRVEIVEPDVELLSGTVQQACVSIETLSPPQYSLEVGFDFYLDYEAKLPSEFLTVHGLVTPIPTAWKVYTPDPRPAVYSWSTDFSGEFWPFSPSGHSLAPWGFTHTLADEPDKVKIDLKAVPWYEGKLVADVEVSGVGSVPSEQTLSWNAIENKVIPVEISSTASDGDSIEITLSNVEYQLRCGIDWFAETTFQGFLEPLQGLLEAIGADSIHLFTYPQSDWVILTPDSSDSLSLSMTTKAMHYDHVNVHIKRVISTGITETFPIHDNSYAALTFVQSNNFNMWHTVLLNSESVATFIDLIPNLGYSWILMIDGVVVATSSTYYEMGSGQSPDSELFKWDSTQQDMDLVVKTDLTGYVDVSFSAFNSTDTVLTPMNDTVIWLGKIEPTHGDYWAAVTNPEAFNFAMMGAVPSISILNMRYLVVDELGQTYWTQNTRPTGQYKIWVVRGYNSSQGMFTQDQVIFERELSITQSGHYVLIGDQTESIDSLRVLIDQEDPVAVSSTTSLSPSHDWSDCYYIGDHVQIRMKSADDIEVPFAWAEFESGERIQMASFGSGYFYSEINLRPISEGNQDLTIEIMDVAGNIDTLTYPIRIDNTNPRLEEIDISTSSGFTTFSCEVEDTTPLTSATVYYSTGSSIDSEDLIITQGSPAIVSGSFPESDEFFIEVVDYVGNTGYYDTVCPTLSISDEYDRIDINHVRLHMNSEDFGSGLDGYMVFFNGTPYFSSTSDSFVIDLRVPSVGASILQKEWNYSLPDGMIYYGFFSGNLNGDEYDDIIWRAIKWHNDNGTMKCLHVVQALDGATRTLSLNITLSDQETYDIILQPCIHDFDSDGKDEIAYASQLLGNVRLFDGETGTIQWTYSYGGPLETNFHPDLAIGMILPGDFNSDGRDDLLVTRGYGADAFNSQGGTKFWTWNSTFAFYEYNDFAIVDCNEDGYDDVYMHRGDGVFYFINGRYGTESFDYCGKYTAGVIAANVLPVGGIECVTLAGTKVASVYEDLSLCVWLVNETWLYYDLPWGMNSTMNLADFDAYDIDNDGLAEVFLVYCYSNGTNQIYRFICFDIAENRTVWSISSTEQLKEICIVDVNQDGHQEVVGAYDTSVGYSLLRVYDAKSGILLAQGIKDKSIDLSVMGDFDHDGQIESAHLFSDEFEVWDLCNDAGTLLVGGWVNITVIVEDVEGNEASDFIIIDITEADAPDAPVITTSSADDHSVSFFWSASSSSDVVVYEIYRGNGTSPSPYNMQPIAEVTSDVTSYNDTGLLPGKYHYCVIAVDSEAVCSPRSNEISHWVGAIDNWSTFGNPEAPTKIRLVRTETGISLSWNITDSDISIVRIFRSNSSISTTSVGIYHEQDSSDLDFSEELYSDEGYWYALTAVDSEGHESRLSVSIYSGVYEESVQPNPSLLDTIIGFLLEPTTLIIIVVVVIVVIIILRR